jgi:hypothetical protein
MSRKKLAPPTGRNLTQKTVKKPIPGSIYIIWPKRETDDFPYLFLSQFDSSEKPVKSQNILVSRGELVTFLYTNKSMYYFLFKEHTLGCYQGDVEFYEPNWK